MVIQKTRCDGCWRLLAESKHGVSAKSTDPAADRVGKSFECGTAEPTRIDLCPACAAAMLEWLAAWPKEGKSRQNGSSPAATPGKPKSRRGKV